MVNWFQKHLRELYCSSESFFLKVCLDKISRLDTNLVNLLKGNKRNKTNDFGVICFLQIRNL